MIVLDTHIWIWWVHGDSRLSADHESLIQNSEATGLGISEISLWEVAKLIELGRLSLPVPIADWFRQALSYPGITLFRFSPEIEIESTRLGRDFHRDPADQLIVATARILSSPLVTSDMRIRRFAGVNTP